MVGGGEEGRNVLFGVGAEVGAEVVHVGCEGVDCEAEGADVGLEVLDLPF